MDVGLAERSQLTCEGRVLCEAGSEFEPMHRNVYKPVHAEGFQT